MDILNRTFRANPDYELAPLSELTDSERAFLGDLTNAESCYGILRPRAKGSCKAVCRDTAALWKALQQPGPVPPWARADNSANEAITQLVFDGVLALWAGDTFVSGASAGSLIAGAASKAIEPLTALGRLSNRALEYAISLRIDEPLVLSTRLYHYGRIPVSPRWMQRFPSTEAIAAELNTDEHWRASRREGWLVWHSTNGSSDGPRSGYKIYVSPQPQFVPDAFHALCRAARQFGVRQFKAGNDACGLLRPDKIVAYFDSKESLENTAAELKRTLHGLPPHGVPFTAELAGDGLLSWGVDPPTDGDAGEWHRGESWRLHVVKRLAAAIVETRRTSELKTDPRRYALDRIRLDGIDPLTWVPLSFAEKRGDM